MPAFIRLLVLSIQLAREGQIKAALHLLLKLAITLFVNALRVIYTGFKKRFDCA